MKKMLAPRADDFLFVSYPGSGNTWLRRMLAYVILRLGGADEAALLDPDAHLSIIPSLEKGGEAPAGVAGPSRRIVKTHARVSGFANDALYLVRRPEDCLVAYYHFREVRGLNVAQGIDAFCAAQADAWRRHVADALEAARAGRRAMRFLTYEGMEKDAERSLQSACDFLRLNVPQDVRADAAAAARLDRLKSRLPPERWAKHNLRGGRVGSGEVELQRKTLLRIRGTLEPVYAAAAVLAAAP